MKFAKKFLILIGVPVIIFGLPLLWFWLPEISCHLEIGLGIRAIEEFDPNQRIDSSTSFGANTFTNEVSSGTIKELYYKAASAVLSNQPDAKTYHWLDQLGWPRVSVVADAVNGHLEVCAACNNDNDSVSISFVPGSFSEPDAKLLPSHDLPKGTLRCDW